MFRHKIEKTISFILAMVLVIPIFVGVFDYGVKAASTILNNGRPQVDKVTDVSNTEITNLKGGQVFNLTFYFDVSDNTSGKLITDVKTQSITFDTKDDSKKLLLKTNWSTSSTSTLKLSYDTGYTLPYKAELIGVTNQGISEGTYLKLDLKYQGESYEISDIVLGDSYFQKGSSSSSDDIQFTADTSVENVIVQDKDGNRLDEITKDTPPFTIIVTFLEFGMEEVDFDNIPDSALSVLFKDGSGFYSSRGTGGTLEPLLSSANGTPRFKAIFKNISYDGKENTSITVVPRYQIDGEHKRGQDIVAFIREAKVDKEEEDKDKIAPLKPYIIVSQYSYGDQPIEAGTDFTLNLSYTNTSDNIPLENIVLTVSTPEDLSISSSSNTVYVESMPNHGTLSHSVSLQAKPNAKVGSAELTIDFKYQYIDEINKTREEATTSEKIAVPITQVDRFELDPIADIPDTTVIGEPFDMTLSYVNKGKASTNNVSITIKSDSDMILSEDPTRVGVIEPGKTGSTYLTITPNETGELKGEVVVSYEDENDNEKELTMPFSIYVDEPPAFEPPPEDIPEVEEEKTSTTTIITSIVGALFIAAPVTYYFVKRKKQKESEFFDEDF